MNRLPTEKRKQILSMLVEGASMRSTARVAGVSRRTVTRPQIEAGTVAWKLHDMTLRAVRAGHVQCEEIWSFACAERRNVPLVEGSQGWAGEVWTWTAMGAGTNPIISFAVGHRSRWPATMFMGDLSGVVGRT